jgi:hypothetical protein
MADAKPVNFAAMAAAAAILRDVNFTDESAKLVTATWLEAKGADATTMISVIDDLMVQLPHLFAPHQVETPALNPEPEPDYGFVGITAKMIASKKAPAVVPESNPFLDRTWNLTAQHMLKRSNPALAAQLEQEAQI